jgi:hypothetical protein
MNGIEPDEDDWSGFRNGVKSFGSRVMGIAWEHGNDYNIRLYSVVEGYECIIDIGSVFFKKEISEVGKIGYLKRAEKVMMAIAERASCIAVGVLFGDEQYIWFFHFCGPCSG